MFQYLATHSKDLLERKLLCHFQQIGDLILGSGQLMHIGWQLGNMHRAAKVDTFVQIWYNLLQMLMISIFSNIQVQLTCEACDATRDTI